VDIHRQIKRIFLPVILILMISCAPGQILLPMLVPDPDHLLRYDGLYQSLTKYDDSYWYYFRFYPEGTVLFVSSEGEPKEVVVWLDKDHPDNSKGYYTINGSTVEFTITGKEGRVDYRGTILGEEIVFKAYSHINGNNIVFVCDFVEIPWTVPEDTVAFINQMIFQ
jgi:hypothetical protein